MREDRYTNTVEDAAAWEAARSYGSYDDGRPSRAEAEEDARLDRLAEKRRQQPSCSGHGSTSGR